MYKPTYAEWRENKLPDLRYITLWRRGRQGGNRTDVRKDTPLPSEISFLPAQKGRKASGPSPAGLICTALAIDIYPGPSKSRSAAD
jgi:hypothetical protein